MVFTYHSLRMRYEPSEGSMMIDVSTIHSLELVQNLHNLKSKDCLYGLLNETLTPMGARLLRNNVLQPLTDADVLTTRYAAVDDLTTKEEMFFATRAGATITRTILTYLIYYSAEEILGRRQNLDTGAHCARRGHTCTDLHSSSLHPASQHCRPLNSLSIRSSCSSTLLAR
jgi:DNA mismatch repair ATPase MutS